MSETFPKRLLVSLCGLQLIAITLMSVFPAQALTLLLTAMGLGVVSIIFVLHSRKNEAGTKSPVVSLIVLSVLVLAAIGVYVFFIPGSV
ncbi:MAG: hypothetical protein GFH27_549287n114 [Chloroflexi bacterium AL-W]|nr:hypothetical protein [Chloroflexi bacterium AL-N1]NOK66388.1 hypothetical protein [Chloroflexi bacterium AL-N10]NOK71776.1 hypothetical protein [Chloroflexi bacterium AL-N5]NOK81033.1 hypothetical protein [Chloroflexi bacterium AL-W]NOK89306.1 hypothetical protein [Chloroflexi bacterium AL-N15]